MLDYLTGLVSRLGHWGYLIVFLVVMLECQAFLGLLMPGESLVIVSGFFAGQRLFDLDTLIVTVSAAAIAGDSIGYELGRHLGRSWVAAGCFGTARGLASGKGALNILNASLRAMAGKASSLRTSCTWGGRSCRS